MKFSCFKRRGFSFLAVAVLFAMLLLPQMSFAARSARDIMKDELEQISQSVDRMNLDDTIKLEGGKTHKKIVNDALDRAKDKVEDEDVGDEEARLAVQAVQFAIVNPYLFKDSPPVPKGEIFEDLVPQLIKLAFKVAWVVVFISFVVSGVFMILSLDSEDRLVKAKAILYYSLIGFAFITLAFAIVKAFTNIDFFAFV